MLEQSPSISKKAQSCNKKVSQDQKQNLDVPLDKDIKQNSSSSDKKSQKYIGD